MTPKQPILIRDGFSGVGFGAAIKMLAKETGLPIEEHGVEKLPEARATREAEGMTTVGHDVCDIQPEPGIYDGELHAPPCTTFSICGKGEGRKYLDVVLHGVQSYDEGQPLTYEELAIKTGDERTALVLEPLRIVLASRPRFIVLEQTKAVLPVWRAYADVLRKRGYSAVAEVMHSEQYGVPQARERAVLIARRDGIEARIPEPTHSRYYRHDPARLDPGVLPWISMSDGNGKNNRPGRGRTDGPSPTITGGGVATGGAEPIGNQARKGLRRSYDAGKWVGPWFGTGNRLSVEEAARLQSFPGGFKFQGTEGKKYLQIGNAVPPLMALAILRMFFTPESLAARATMSAS